MKSEIEKVLEEVRPLLAMHAGNVECVGVDGDTVTVRLLGTCHGCPLAGLTLKAGIEELLKEKIPGVKRVIAVE